MSAAVFALAFLGVLVMLIQRRSRRLGRRRLVIRRRRRNFTTWQRRQIYARDGGRCRYCGVKVHYKADCKWRDGCNHDFQADHLIPYRDKGPTTVDNGVTACRFHNQSKGAKPIHQFLATSRHRRRRADSGGSGRGRPLRGLTLPWGHGRG